MKLNALLLSASIALLPITASAECVIGCPDGSSPTSGFMFDVQLGYAGLGTADWGGDEGYSYVAKTGGSNINATFTLGTDFCDTDCSAANLQVNAVAFETVTSQGEALSTTSGNPAYVVNNGAARISGTFNFGAQN